ncbi:hypothetical protein [Pseudoxanthomonas dokdonensis]|uniref:hypothetical protein n=1 Tax=Pseudoxanthomonas dokdonensis TaxID=344882 RepID=UPI0012ED13AB|nr:hypothetical protein [Pseudoxanthomonas dokdonensis]
MTDRLSGVVAGRWLFAGFMSRIVCRTDVPVVRLANGKMASISHTSLTDFVSAPAWTTMPAVPT